MIGKIIIQMLEGIMTFWAWAIDIWFRWCFFWFSFWGNLISFLFRNILWILITILVLLYLLISVIGIKI